MLMDVVRETLDVISSPGYSENSTGDGSTKVYSISAIINFFNRLQP